MYAHAHTQQVAHVFLESLDASIVEGGISGPRRLVSWSVLPPSLAPEVVFSAEAKELKKHDATSAQGAVEGGEKKFAYQRSLWFTFPICHKYKTGM